MVRSSNFPGNFDNQANLPDVGITTPLVPAHWNNVKDAVVSVQYALGRRPSSWPTHEDGVERKSVYEVLAGLLGIGAGPADLPVPTWPPEGVAAGGGGGGLAYGISGDADSLPGTDLLSFACVYGSSGDSSVFTIGDGGLRVVKACSILASVQLTLTGATSPTLVTWGLWGAASQLGQVYTSLVADQYSTASAWFSADVLADTELRPFASQDNPHNVEVRPHPFISVWRVG